MIDDVIAGLASRLIQPGHREAASQALAARFGAEALLIFLRDPDLGLYLPAPGYSQKLADGSAWQAFLRSVIAGEEVTGSLRLAGDSAPRPVRGYPAEGGASVCALIGGSAAPAPDRAAFLLLLPLVAGALSGELAAATASARAQVARETAARATVLSRALDTTRGALQDALQRAETRGQALAEAHARLKEQTVELESSYEHLQEQSAELEAQTSLLLSTAASLEVEAAARAQALAAAARREDRYRALVEATTSVIWVTDAANRIVADAEAWRQFTGQSEPDCQGTGWAEAIHPDERGQVLEPDRIRTESQGAAEVRVRRYDGAWRLMAIRRVAVEGHTPPGSEWVNSATDITEAMRTEQQLRQVQKLQSMGTFAGGMAHEVNNQMTVVIGCGRFALGAMDKASAAADDIRQMISAAERTAKVAQQLLAFSRRQVTQPRRLALLPVLQELRPLLTRLMGADLHLEIPAEGPPTFVDADPTQLEQVFINLTANARDALSTGGRLTIGLSHVTLDEGYGRLHGGIHSVPGSYALLSFSDSGSGMTRETLQQVFEPFFTTKGVGQGTGLGLSMVYGIVKQHGGFVWAYSEPGLGTTVKVYLPLADAGQLVKAAELPSRRASARTSQTRILVVEDDPAVRQITRRSLEDAGYLVEESMDGQHALDSLDAANMPDLLVTDIIMPGINGRDVADAFTRHRPGLPVLFMSGYTGDDRVLRGLLPKGSPFIQKPFSPESLVRLVDSVLGALAGQHPPVQSPSGPSRDHRKNS